MARTDATNVGLIIEVDSSISLTSFIETANELVTELCTGSAGPSTAYSAARLELIERWLAAHFYAIRDMRVAGEKAGPVGTSFQYQVGLSLANTMYGQQAMILDTNGKLASLSKSSEEGKPKKVGITWAGTATT